VLYAAGTIKGWFSKAERKSKNKGSSTTARTDDDDEDYDDDDDDDRLQAWKKAKRTNLQLVDVRGKKETLLLKAAKRSREIKIQYHGGRDVGTIRKVIPRQVFKVEGYRSTYLLAYDFTHDEDRTFNLNDFEIL
jgi:hypothetical protein